MFSKVFARTSANMNLTPEQQDILNEVERRKAANEDPCDCGGPSKKNIEKGKFFCEVCWWEGVVLKPHEIELLEEMYDAGLGGILKTSPLPDPNEDRILNQQDFEY